MRWGDLPAEEAFRVFNMGVGMVAVTSERQRAPPDSFPIGRLVELAADSGRCELVR